MIGRGEFQISFKPGAIAQIKAEHGFKSDGELADRINVSRPMLSQMQNGHRNVAAAFIAGAALHLGIPFHAGPDSIYQINENEEA